MIIEADKMKIKCDFCNKTETKTQDELFDAGWSKVTMYTPVRKTITACPDHAKELGEVLIKIIK
jgi:hypothetical protein